MRQVLKMSELSSRVMTPYLLRVTNAEHKLWDERSRPKSFFTLQIAQKIPKFHQNQPLAMRGCDCVVGADRASESSGRMPDARCQNLLGFRYHLPLSFFLPLFIAGVSNLKATRRYSTEKQRGIVFHKRVNDAERLLRHHAQILI